MLIRAKIVKPIMEIAGYLQKDWRLLLPGWKKDSAAEVVRGEGGRRTSTQRHIIGKYM